MKRLGIVSPIYNVCLATYYMLVVKYAMTENKLSNYAEPFMHLFALSFGFITASIAAWLALFNNAGTFHLRSLIVIPIMITIDC
jgi:hypothetical protein